MTSSRIASLSRSPSASGRAGGVGAASSAARDIADPTSRSLRHSRQSMRESQRAADVAICQDDRRQSTCEPALRDDHGARQRARVPTIDDQLRRVLSIGVAVLDDATADADASPGADAVEAQKLLGSA